jgi:hypothetical protein
MGTESLRVPLWLDGRVAYSNGDSAFFGYFAVRVAPSKDSETEAEWKSFYPGVFCFGLKICPGLA